MYVKYSPVCNTNPELYDRYLRLVDKLSNGPSVCVGTGFGGGSGNFSGVVSGSRLLLGPVTVGSGQGTGDGETTSSETSAGTVGENRQSEDSSVRNDGFYGVSAGGVKVGPNYARNQLWREKKKAMKARRRGVVDSNVPEWRRKCERNPQTQEALEKMWISKNKVATLKYEAEAKRLEASAANSRPFKFVERKPKTQEELDLEAAERIKKLKQRIEKHDADIAYWKKRQDSGAIDKAIALENEILDGQLSGKYDPFASRRMLGWAKTVKTHGSGTGSGSGSSGSLDKTVWSGSGATTKTDLSVLEQKVAVYEEKLKKAEKEVVDVNKKADALNKQLITVTVESERKDKELLEVRKFKEYLEKAKREKKRRADNEFEAFRTQADCSY